jgi:hypothetical protein
MALVCASLLGYHSWAGTRGQAIVTPNPGKYYVSTTGDDANDGSASTPWRTLSRADKSAKPGDTIYVAAGTYNGENESEGRLKTISSGAPTAPIRWISESKWGAKLTSAKTGNEAVWWNQGSFVEIQGFDITGKGALGIYNEGSHTRIVGNHVHDIPATGCPATGGAGIHNGNYGASDNDVIANRVHHIGDHNQRCVRVHGIYHANLRGRIDSNLAFLNQGWGIHLWHAATNVSITNNVIFANGYGGILIGGVANEYPGGSGANGKTTVANNIIADNGHAAGWRNLLGVGAGGYGIQEYGDIGPGNLLRQNVLYQNKPGDIKKKLATEAENVAKDPQFINYRADGKGDYRLKDTSPACSGKWLHPACGSGETAWKATP